MCLNKDGTRIRRDENLDILIKFYNVNFKYLCRMKGYKVNILFLIFQKQFLGIIKVVRIYRYEFFYLVVKVKMVFG